MNSFFSRYCVRFFKMDIVNSLAVILLFGYVYGLSDLEVKRDFIKEAMICTKTIHVDMADLLELEQLKPPTKTNVKCLLACVYKKIGTFNKEGMYDLNAAYKYAETVKNGDEKRFENSKKLADICVKVNDVKVSDGNKGCERAGHAFNCVVEHAPKLGFQL